MFDRRLVLNFDIFLLIAVLVVCLCGILNLKSICTSDSGVVSAFYYKQIYWVIIGTTILFVIVNINYINIINYAYYIHFFVLFLLVMVLFYGTTKYGSQRWITFGFLSFQPSEVSKITFVLCLSKFFSENISQNEYTLKDLFIPFFLLLCTIIPIYIQPDLGTAGIIFIIFISFMFFININKKTVLYVLLFLASLLPFLWFFLKDYQKRRIMVFINPELDPLNAGYQIIQSKIAIGSGGLFGKGFGLGTQSQLRFLPEQHTDFVFSVWAEEWGFLGCLFVLFMYFFIMYRGVSISYFCKNFYGTFLGLGISIFFFLHFIINVFMATGLFPVVGVPLPFMSYGGSSLVTCFVGTALLININMRKFK